jgi:hypothetical protein
VCEISSHEVVHFLFGDYLDRRWHPKR